eukprot:22381-Prorocentrum_minimum.AAC.1
MESMVTALSGTPADAARPRMRSAMKASLAAWSLLRSARVRFRKFKVTTKSVGAAVGAPLLPGVAVG